MGKTKWWLAVRERGYGLFWGLRCVNDATKSEYFSVKSYLLLKSGSIIHITRKPQRIHDPGVQRSHQHRGNKNKGMPHQTNSIDHLIRPHVNAAFAIELFSEFPNMENHWEDPNTRYNHLVKRNVNVMSISRICTDCVQRISKLSELEYIKHEWYVYLVSKGREEDLFMFDLRQILIVCYVISSAVANGAW